VRDKEGKIKMQKRKRWFSPEKINPPRPKVNYTEVKPKLPLGLKLEVAQFPLKER
jgi:hypothetical protein